MLNPIKGSLLNTLVKRRRGGKKDTKRVEKKRGPGQTGFRTLPNHKSITILIFMGVWEINLCKSCCYRPSLPHSTRALRWLLLTGERGGDKGWWNMYEDWEVEIKTESAPGDSCYWHHWDLPVTRECGDDCDRQIDAIVRRKRCFFLSSEKYATHLHVVSSEPVFPGSRFKPHVHIQSCRTYWCPCNSSVRPLRPPMSHMMTLWSEAPENSSLWTGSHHRTPILPGSNSQRGRRTHLLHV